MCQGLLHGEEVVAALYGFGRIAMSQGVIKKTVTLILTDSFNLSCSYCYQGNRQKRYMPYECAERIIEDELMADDGYEEAIISFFGGEPFMAFDLIKKCYDFVWDRDWPKKRICFVTTNGTLVHGDIQEWLTERKDHSWCGLSLDGPREIHNKNRCNSFERIDLDFFHKTWPEQTIKMTVSPETLPHLAEGVKFIHELGFPVANNLAYGVDWSAADNVSILGEQLYELIEFYLENPSIKPCTMLSMSIPRLATVKKKDIHRWCGAGVHMRTYDVDGTLYPCHLFAPGALGAKDKKIIEEIDFNNDELFRDEKCENCILQAICPTCYGSNLIYSGSLGKRDDNLCQLTKVIAKAVALFEYRKIERYGIDSVGTESEQYKMVKGISLVQTL